MRERLAPPRAGVLAVFGIVDVDQPPLPGFFAVDLGFDPARGYGRPSFRIVA